MIDESERMRFEEDAATQRQIDDLTAERDKLLAFKEYVHRRLDEAAVAADPESPHRAEGCRIGGRLDPVFAERDRLRKALADEEVAHLETIRHRDFCERWADKLASGVGDIELIGEHSNLNNPWETAYGLMRTLAEFQAVEAERDELLAACKAIHEGLRRYGLQIDELFGHDERLTDAIGMVTEAIAHAE